jgi:DNA-binding NarL/FixJ family response regulator
MMVRIAVVEDDHRYRQSLETLFEVAEGFELMNAFPDGHDVTEPARALAEAGAECPWDVVVTDMQMPRMGGIEGTRLIKGYFPDVRVLVLTVYEDPTTILQAICAGADGYLLKHSAVDDILAQVEAVAKGGAPLTPAVAATVLKLVRNPKPSRTVVLDIELSPREHEVLTCLVEGLSYKQVAAELCISIDTVRSHIRRLYRKLRVHSVAEAVSRAIRDGIV